MCLDNEIWSLSRPSLNIRAMVETSKNWFSHVFNGKLIDSYIKWNNNNYSCVILNVDVSCLSSPIRFGFDGIIKNTFDHYLAGFLRFCSRIIYILIADMLSTRASCWPKTWTLMNLFVTLIFYSVSISSKVPKLDIIFMLYWFNI
jgi:hypothetical protein